MKQIPLLMALVLGLSFCSLTDKLKKAVESNSNSAGSSGSGATGDEKVEKPAPTAAEIAAIAGGQTAKWDQQGMTFTVPTKWSKSSADKNSFLWMGGQTASLNVSVSSMSDDFPVDASLKAYWDSSKTRLKNGELDQARWLEIDGIKGIQFREAKPDKGGDIRRLQWIAYRKFAGIVQNINIMLAADSDNFTKRQDEFYGILYSSKVVH